jgi:hypothetical protein
MRNFDFLVIGAMKSGTTTIHDILSRDPRILLPLGKESPYFTDQAKLKRGLNTFFKRYYPKNLEGRCIGKVSPQYMAWYDMAAENITKENPNAKLIAILRDPIDRLISHYSMCVGMGIETRNINDAISSCLNNPPPKRNEINYTNSYILWSQYGEILTTYQNSLPSFDVDVLIMSFDDLVKNQKVFFKRLYEHIGLKLRELPTEDMKSLSRGGDIDIMSKLFLRFPMFTKLFIKLIPYKYKDVVRVMRIGAQVALDSPKVRRNEINDENLKKLEKMFASEASLLRKLGFSPYWDT